MERFVKDGVAVKTGEAVQGARKTSPLCAPINYVTGTTVAMKQSLTASATIMAVNDPVKGSSKMFL